MSDPLNAPDGEAVFRITREDVVMGRGGSSQNHSGNVTYRKLVHHNKELYATAPKHYKLEISKAIVAATRQFGGRFLEAHDGENSGYIDIGDKRAWSKTSQALREGQVEIRAKLEAEQGTATSSGDQKIAAGRYKNVIEKRSFLEYSCDFLKSIYEDDEVSGEVISGKVVVQAAAPGVASTLTSKSSTPSSGLPSQGIPEGTVDGSSEIQAVTMESLAAVKPRALNAVSLRTWVPKALQHCINANNGGVSRFTVTTSHAYLEAALKIAKSLTDQIIQGEELHRQHSGTFTELDFLPCAGQDWADYVTILHDEDCLQIDSAKILCPQGKRMSQEDNNSSDEKQSSSQRMYYLGLVFYELFTGGETPPEYLRALAMCDNAFVSLSTLALVNNKDGDERSTNIENKRHQVGASGGEIGLCKSCCEYMRLAGFASPMCDLIFNMLDSVYGDLSGNECYTNMMYVAADLQLMIDKPSIFLRGLDMDKLSLAGLSINEIEIPRKEQLESIKSCYDLSKSGSCAVAILKGESGLGKSWLAYHLGSIVVSEGGLFLRGKFDQMQVDQAKPFSALSTAFDEYCDLLLGLNDANMFKLITDNLQAALGPDPRELFKVIPKLEIVLGEVVEYGDDSATNTDKNWGNAFFRLQYLMSQFIDVISATSVVSVVLFLDDIQWIDDASLGILKTILRQKPRKFLFLCCCCDNEMANDHSFWKMVTSLGAVGVDAMQVELTSMNENALNTAVSELLQTSPRLTKSLSSVLFSKTKGNVLFLLQLLQLLYHDNMLYLDFGGQRWAWNEDHIASMQLPDNIAICFTNGIGKLSSKVQLALNVLSMFGAAKLSYLKLLEDELSMELLKPLKEAAVEGLVTITNGCFRFCHDLIQEASLNLVQGQDRRSNHLAYGKFLVKKAIEANDDDMFFMAVHQINLGGPSAITDRKDHFDMASYNAVAGKKSMSMAQFDAALSFFKSGISFLRNGHWQDHYDFSLEVYELACKSGVAAAKISDVIALSSQILENAKSMEDTIEIRVVNMSMLAFSNPVEALSQGLSIVSDLGEEIPTPSNEAWERERGITYAMLEGLSDEALLNYKMMSDTKKLTVMKVIEKLGVVAYMVNPPMHPFLVVKRVQITISHGLSPYAPATFTALGSTLASTGDILVGYKFALLGKALIEKIGVCESKAEVLFVASEIQMYCEPAQSVNDVRIRGEHAAISAGDIVWACLNRLGYCQEALWLTNNLASVDELFTKSRSIFEQYDMPVQLFFSLTIHRVIFNMVGKEVEALALDGQLTMMKQMFPMPHLMMLSSFYDMYSSFLMNRDNVKECCEAFLSLEIQEHHTSFLESIKVFISGLVSFQLYRDTGDSSWKSRGVERINEFKVFSDQGSDWNFEHKLQLMEAENYACSGDYTQAEDSYKKAIASAQVHKYINDEALACELAGKFFLNTNKKTSSLEYLRLAHERYCKWGAVGKASQLFDFIAVKY